MVCGQFIVIENWTRRVQNALGQYFHVHTNTNTRIAEWRGSREIPEQLKDILEPFIKEDEERFPISDFLRLRDEGTISFKLEDGALGKELNIILVKFPR